MMPIKFKVSMSLWNDNDTRYEKVIKKKFEKRTRVFKSRSNAETYFFDLKNYIYNLSKDPHGPVFNSFSCDITEVFPK